MLIGTIILVPSGSAAKSGTGGTANVDGDLLRRSNVSIPVHIYNGFLVVATGQIGGQTHNFVLDTGTAPSILNERSLEKLGLPLTQSSIVAVGRSIKTQQTVLPNLGLGPIHVTALRVNVMDLSRLEKNLGIEVAGLIGMDVLGRASFQLDYEKRQLEFGPVAQHGVRVSYDATTGLALAEATLQRKPVRLVVDTGSDLVVVYGSRWATFGSVSPTFDEEGASVAERVPARPIAHPELALGGHQFSGMRTYYVPSAGQTPYDGFFGVRALKLRGLSFDRESQTLFLLN
jgi:predicted aspartyl protease